jgi:ElaB/YqjD/DUF883 family membrane-anchored ribosome-binding protein
MEEQTNGTRGTPESREGYEAGASGVLERATRAAERAGDAAGGALHDAATAARGAVDSVRSTISDQAAAIRAAAGDTLERRPLVGGAVGALVGVVAGALGGWWAARATAERGLALPSDAEEACRVHFMSYTLRPEELEFDHARPGYLLGWVAAGNPEYRGREYDEVEAELRRAFTDDYAADYDALRDFARFGFERGALGW